MIRKLAATITLLSWTACGSASAPSAGEPKSTPTSEELVKEPEVKQEAPAKTVSQPKEEPVLTCQTVGKRPAPGICGVLESAPRADVKDPLVQRTVEVWKRLEGPFGALSGRETALVVLSDAATMPDKSPLAPAAFICPGAPPTVYVPDTLLKLVDKKRSGAKAFPDDFLAFVLGHELGHRMNDLTGDGCQMAAFQRPGQGVKEEELADARAAFFIANAGFSAGRVARKDMVSEFLKAEFSLGRSETKGRRDALLGALASFDGYEALYQAGLSIAMTGDMTSADRLLSWTDELVTARGVPLPEVRVVRAIARINRAAGMAPWGADLGMPVSLHRLRCTPLHPGHSGLWEKPDKPVRGPDIELGRKLLRQALRFLDEAEARGATPFTVSAARACASLYLGEVDNARRAQSIAEKRMPDGAPSSVKRVLRANRALVDFLSYAKRSPIPKDDDEEKLAAWVQAFPEYSRAHLGLVALLDSMTNPDDVRQADDELAGQGASCSGTPTGAFSPMTKVGALHGSCPAGFSLVQAIPSAEASRQSGSNQGITQCRRGDAEVVTVRLAAATEPALDSVTRTLLSSGPPPALSTLGSWACSCASLKLQGVSDTGDSVYLARCPKVGVTRAALVVRGPTKRVHSVVRYSR